MYFLGVYILRKQMFYLTKKEIDQNPFICLPHMMSWLCYPEFVILDETSLGWCIHWMLCPRGLYATLGQRQTIEGTSSWHHVQQDFDQIFKWRRIYPSLYLDTGMLAGLRNTAGLCCCGWADRGCPQGQAHIQQARCGEGCNNNSIGMKTKYIATHVE